MLAVAESRTMEPERVATWDPLEALMFVTANLAAIVDWPPTNRSTVELFGYKAPDVWFQNVSIALVGQVPEPVTIPRVEERQPKDAVTPLVPLICSNPVAPGLRLSIPAVVLLGEIVMFPVVEPPIVKVWFNKLWIEGPELLNTKPDPDPPLDVVAERVAIGEVEPLTPVIANLAEVVDDPPINRSKVEASFG